MQKNDKPLKVLAIDDDPDIILYMKKIIENRGHIFFHAFDLNSGKQILKDKLPNVVFIDLKFENENSTRFIRQLQKEKYFKIMSLVIMSSYETPKLLEFSHLVGALKYLKKPLSNVLLTQVLNQVDMVKPVIEVNFPPSAKATGQGKFQAQIHGINEVNCEVITPVYFEYSQIIQPEGYLFKKLDLPIKCIMASAKSRTNPKGGSPITDFRFVGTSEEKLKILRQIKLTGSKA